MRTKTTKGLFLTMICAIALCLSLVFGLGFGTTTAFASENMESSRIVSEQQFFANQQKSLSILDEAMSPFIQQESVNGIERVYEDSFAGVFIDENGNLNIGIVEGSLSRQIESLQNGLRGQVIYREDKFSYNFLARKLESLSSIMSDYGIHTAELREDKNQIYVYLRDANQIEDTKRFLFSSGSFDEDALNFIVDDNATPREEANTAWSGEGITRTTGGSGTIAVNAIDNTTGRMGVITNQHVARIGDTMRHGGNTIGATTRAENGGTIDAAFIQFQNQDDWDMTPNARNSGNTDTNIRLGNNAQIVAGARIKKIGLTSNTTFGTIVSTNVSTTPTPVGGGTGITKTNCFNYDTKTAGGDSGSPIYFDDQAGTLWLLGVHFSGTGTRGWACRIANVMATLNITPITNDTYQFTTTGGNVSVNGLNITPNSRPIGRLTVPSQFNGNNVTQLGTSAFSSRTGISTVDLPNTLTTIGNSAFSGVTQLSQITIPASVTSIGSNAFVKNIHIILADGQTQIQENLFQNLTKSFGITIPASITSIGQNTFAFCESLTSVTFGPNSKLNSIGLGAFSGCSSLQSIIIPSSVKTIGGYAFAECYSLASVTFEEGSQLTMIDHCAFANCISLTNIVIPDSVTSINGAFNMCSGLKSILIPSGVTFTAADFDGCDNLTIYAEATSAAGWHSDWNYSNRPVIWGCTLSADKSYVVSFTKTASSISNPSIDMSAPYREGHVFIGWSAVDRVYAAADVTDVSDGALLTAFWASCDTAMLLNAYNYNSDRIELSEGQSPERTNNQIVLFDEGKYIAHISKYPMLFHEIHSGDMLSDSGDYTIVLHSKIDGYTLLYTFTFKLINEPKFAMDYQVLAWNEYRTNPSQDVTVLFADSTTQSIVIRDPDNFRFLISYDGINYFEGSAVGDNSQLWVQLISKTNANYIEYYHIYFVSEDFELPNIEIREKISFVQDESLENNWNIIFGKTLAFNDDLYTASYSKDGEPFVECENDHLFDELGDYVVELFYLGDERIVFYYAFSIWGMIAL